MKSSKRIKAHMDWLAWYQASLIYIFFFVFKIEMAASQLSIKKSLHPPAGSRNDGIHFGEVKNTKRRKRLRESQSTELRVIDA